MMLKNESEAGFGGREKITEHRYISYADQQRYLDDGWELMPQTGPHAAYGVIATREIPMTETRKRRVVRHVQAHRRQYTITVSAAMVGTVLYLVGDLVIGALGNGLWSVVAPVFGIK